MRNFYLRCYLATILLLVPLTTLTAQEPGTPPEGRPNFIVIFIDDLGFADVQPFSNRHETPNLARMAEEGRTFTSFYTASSVCTPSRPRFNRSLRKLLL